MTLKNKFFSLALLLVLVTGGVFAAGSADSTTDIPEVWIWPTMSLVDPNGSNPEKLAEMQELIVKEVGVMPYAYVPPASDADTKKNLTLGSSSQRLDVWQGNWGDYKEIARPINDLLDNYGPNVKKAFSDAQWAGVTDSEGNIWGLPRLGTMGHTHPTWFNNQMLEDNNISMPQTIDQAIDALKKVRRSNPDAMILIHRLKSIRLGLSGAWTEYGYSNWMDSSGRLQPPEFQPGYKDFIATMADWYSKGYIFKESFIKHDNIEVLKTGKVFMFSGWYSQITIHFQRVLLAGANPGLSYDHPNGLTGPKGLAMTNNASPYAAIMISKRSPNPEAAMKLMNWQFDSGKDNVATAVYGIQGKAWEWDDPNNKYYINRLVEPSEAMGNIYAGEFMVATGLGTDTWYAPNTEDLKRHYEEIRDYATNHDNGKMPFDFDVAYDIGAIKDNVAAYDDIQRALDEGTTNFIIGVRPLSEWNMFIEELKEVGIDDLYDAYTAQYKEIKGL